MLVRLVSIAAVIALPEAMSQLPAELGLLPRHQSSSAVLCFEHPVEGKMPVARHLSVTHNAAYCHVMIQRLRTLLPACRPRNGTPAAMHIAS